MAKRRTTLTVTGSEWLNKHMVRIRFGGPGFDEFVPNEFTDAYVKLVFEQGGGPDGRSAGSAPADGRSAGSAPADGRSAGSAPADGRSAGSAPAEVLRSYTVRSVDPQAREIAIDFVVHGDEGIAGPWAATVAPGAVIDMQGPGGAYTPNTDADWHLFAGDEAAIPAIAVALEALPDDAVGDAFVEVDGPEEEFELRKPDGVRLTWLHRDGAGSPQSPLPAAVRGLDWRPGKVHVFIHGEAQTVMQDLRRYIRREREVPAEWASISGYWRRGMADESFRAWKRDLAATEQAG
ncbi:siderophore-interacting protein [Aldersonia sp. NBC_00410]|uniref:siderophore-interacting protein n=1 Tax=Aldersonia sp. NBC_00410 TaxID=2975954 RepID=UPI00225257F1|nr:siderophore-interacting protein [Aldersonia sp. NBC_00410]MCX5046213.1 siderophore-interacting protein [Aldersonia sp. NBC_00410]